MPKPPTPRAPRSSFSPTPFYESRPNKGTPRETRIRVFHGDCTQLVRLLGTYDFIFADPPFNIGQDYDGYNDNQGWEEFRSFTSWWVRQCWNACNGVMALHGPDSLVVPYLEIARDIGMRRVAWINWHYRFGQCGRANWIDARCHCLIFARPERYTFNADAVLVDSDRVAYGDKRVDETERGGQRLPGTVWGVPSDGPYWGRVQGNNAERMKGCPNQLPELYLARLLKAYTNRGDAVLDPFGGSGTTVTVARALGRSCDTMDVSMAACKRIRRRLHRGAIRV